MSIFRAVTVEGMERQKPCPFFFLTHQREFPSRAAALSAALSSFFLGTAPCLRPEGHMTLESRKIQPLTPDNLSSQVAMETYVIRTNVASQGCYF